jgi:hypothetical protein
MFVAAGEGAAAVSFVVLIGSFNSALTSWNCGSLADPLVNPAFTMFVAVGGGAAAVSFVVVVGSFNSALTSWNCGFSANNSNAPRKRKRKTRKIEG